MQRSYNVADFGADETGISDSTLAIQSCINRCRDDGGGDVIFDVPGVYIVSDAHLDTPFNPELTNNLRLHSALVTYSNVSIYLGAGVTVRLAPQSNCSMIRNNGSDASTTTPDTAIGFDGPGNWDYGNSTVFSDSFSTNVAGTVVTKAGAFAEYKWYSGDVFRYRLFDNSGWGQVTITSKDSDSQITLGTAVPAALRNQTGTVYATVNQQLQVFVPPYNIGYAVYLKNVRGLRFGTINIRNNLKFGVMFVDCYDVQGDLIDGYSPTGGADIFHINGPCRNVYIKEVRGFSGDNIVGLIAGEGIYGNGEAFSSVTYNATNKTLTKGSAWSANLITGSKIRLTSGTGVTPGDRTTATVVSGQGTTVLTLSDTITATDGAANLAGHVEGLYSYIGNEGDIIDVKIDKIHARDDTGSFEPFRCCGPLGTTVANIKIGVISGVVTNGSSAAFIDDAASGNLTGWVGRDISIGEICCYGTKANANFADRTNATVQVTAAGLSSLRIGTLLHWNAVAATSALTHAASITTGSIVIDHLENVAPIVSGSLAGLISIAGTVNQLIVKASKVTGGTGGAILNINGAGTTNTIFSNVDFRGTDEDTSYPFVIQSTAANTVTIRDARIDSSSSPTDTYAIRNGGTGVLTITLENVEFVAIYCPFWCSVASTSTIILGSNITYTGTSNRVIHAAAPTLFRVRNPDFGMLGELTTGTQVKGDTFINTSTAGSGGSPSTNWGTVTVGNVTYNGTAWEKFGRTL